MNDSVKYTGEFFQIINRNYSDKLNDEFENKDFAVEVAVMSPGVRALIVKDNMILLTKEYRYELDDWDFRLPGGKVYDDLNHYLIAKNKKTIEMDINSALRKEIWEETNIIVKRFQFLNCSHCGLTVEWDLYYFLVYEFEEKNNVYKKNSYEHIENQWISINSALELSLEGKIREARSAFELIKYILTKGISV